MKTSFKSIYINIKENKTVALENLIFEENMERYNWLIKSGEPNLSASRQKY